MCASIQKRIVGDGSGKKLVTPERRRTNIQKKCAVGQAQSHFHAK